MQNRVFKIIAIFVLGIVGGIFADQIIWPYFVERPLFFKYRLEQTPIYVIERKEVSIEENSALTDAAEKVQKAVIGVKAQTKAGVLLEGSGLVLTTDGLVITTADLVPQGATLYFFVDGEWPAFKVVKKDIKSNLALVKVEKTNLTTIGFADFEKTRPAERVFLAAREFGAPGKEKFFASPSLLVNEGIIRFLNEDTIQTNIFEKNYVQGSPVFNVRGEAVGLSVVGQDGRVTVIPVPQIRAFTGL